MAEQSKSLYLDYKKLFSTLPQGYIVFGVDDPTFTILEENEMHAQLAMSRPEDVIGKPLLEAFPDNSEQYKQTGKSELIESIRRVIALKKPDIMPQLQYDIPDEQGNFVQKFWSVRHLPVIDENGDVIQVYQATKDITNEVRTSQKLRETELQLERALEVGKICTWSWDLRADRVYGDRNLAFLFGMTEKDIEKGLSISSFTQTIHPEDQPQIEAKIQDTLARDVPYEAEYRTVSRDGGIRWVIARGKLMHNSDGEAINFPGVIIDITDRKIIEKNLNYLVKAGMVLASSLDYKKNLQETAQLAVDEISDWCTIELFDEKRVLQQVAVAHSDPKKVAWAKELRKKQGAHDLTAERGIAHVVRTGEPELYSHIPDEMLVNLANDDDELALIRSLGMSAAIIVPITSKTKTIGVMTFISAELRRHYTEGDLQIAQEVAARVSSAITNSRMYDLTQRELAERRRLQRELAQMNDKLEAHVAERTIQLEKTNLNLERSNRELENFAYVASHDLQEPLRKIQAFGNLLEDEFGEKLGEGRDYLDRMRNAASRMSALINDLLAFSRVTTKKEPLRKVALNGVVDGVLEDLEDLVRRTNGTVNVSKLPSVIADATQMRQLFQNLIANALKFHKPDVAPIVDVKAQKIGEEYEITVSDNGVGFDERYLDKIFAVFQRLNGREKYEGTGIGLAVCRKIVERHGGSITAKSAPESGATFIVTLPNLKHKEGEEL